MDRRLIAALLTPVAGVVLALTPVTPAAAAVTTPQRISALVTLTAPDAAGYRAWDDARLHPAVWAAYHFTWATDYCTVGPDRPLGFDFRMACWRHDFGYRNFHALGVFNDYKTRLDDAFYVDLTARCATYRPRLLRTTCNSLAWVYYQAVVSFGMA